MVIWAWSSTALRQTLSSVGSAPGIRLFTSSAALSQTFSSKDIVYAALSKVVRALGSRRIRVGSTPNEISCCSMLTASEKRFATAPPVTTRRDSGCAKAISAARRVR
ncbi:hypothetical protein JCM24511_00050 [Saitozyma sp. JCM 24511]|nr:hypothetical protein JCM24511_00050 [Saitozyma sp. JCM 24511]